MRTFIADIIPKIQRFSKRLDDLILLTNQHWVVLDEPNNKKIIYIFRKNEELLIAINGKVDRGRWEYLGNNSILIEIQNESYLFKHGFFDENVIALKIDSSSSYVFLINENKFDGELNSIKAISTFLEQKYLTETTQSQNITFKLSGKNSPKIGYTFKMGSHEEYKVEFENEEYKYYRQISTGKYFVYRNKKILTFDDRNSCIDFIESGF